MTIVAVPTLETKDWPFRRAYIFGICIAAALGGLMFGYNWVVIGGAELFYEKYFKLTSAFQVGWAMSCALVGALLGAPRQCKCFSTDAALVLLSLSLVQAQSNRPPSWQPKRASLMTTWGEQLTPDHVLPAYPRPQLVRPYWLNLNGLWDYALTETNAPQPASFSGKILVPFPIESALSGVQQSLLPTQALWYRRFFRAPAHAAGQRLLLHFGAVDWAARVFVNGKDLGQHCGGYDAFSFDITKALKVGENELVVSVLDATGGIQAKGKQSLKPGGIMYSACSGIWQTVWLETVPAAYIDSLRIEPNLDQSRVRVTALAKGQAPPTVKVSVLAEGQELSSAEGKPGEPVSLQLASLKPWSPDSPFLYDLKVECGSDTVTSYHDIKAGDIIDIHRYPGPASPRPEPTRAAVLGEFGGLRWPVPGHLWRDKAKSYQTMADNSALMGKYHALWQAVAQFTADPGLSAAVYTQLTDVETEVNGLLTYDRKVTKVDLASACAAVAHGQSLPAPQMREIIPTER